MFGHKLAIQQLKTTQLHPRNQPRHRHFGSISCAREHAFTEKSLPHRQPVEPADHPAFRPAFDAMCQAQMVEPQKCVFDIGVDPGFLPAFGAFRTQADHTRKVRVARHNKTVLPNGFGERFRDMKAVKRQDRTTFWFDPEGFLILTRIRHGENAVGIGA